MALWLLQSGGSPAFLLCGLFLPAALPLTWPRFGGVIFCNIPQLSGPRHEIGELTRQRVDLAALVHHRFPNIAAIALNRLAQNEGAGTAGVAGGGVGGVAGLLVAAGPGHLRAPSRASSE